MAWISCFPRGERTIAQSRMIVCSLRRPSRNRRSPQSARDAARIHNHIGGLSRGTLKPTTPGLEPGQELWWPPGRRLGTPDDPRPIAKECNVEEASGVGRLVTEVPSDRLQDLQDDREDEEVRDGTAEDRAMQPMERDPVPKHQPPHACQNQRSAVVES